MKPQFALRFCFAGIVKVAAMFVTHSKGKLMNYIKYYAGSIILVLLAGCYSPVTSVPSSTALQVIELKRQCGMCYVNNDYVVALHADGFVHFKWLDNTQTAEHNYFISQTAVDSLTAAFVANGIFSFEDSYESKYDSASGTIITISDGPEDAVTFTKGGQTKTITNIKMPPPELAKLLDGVDLIVNSAQWKKN